MTNYEKVLNRLNNSTKFDRDCLNFTSYAINVYIFDDLVFNCTHYIRQTDCEYLIKFKSVVVPMTFDEQKDLYEKAKEKYDNLLYEFKIKTLGEL